MNIQDENIIKDKPKKVKRKRQLVKHGIYVYRNREEVPRERKKKGRKKKYDPESKATNTVNYSDFSYKINAFFKQTISQGGEIITFKRAMEKYGIFLKCIFNTVDFTNEVQKQDFEANYSRYKTKFLKDNDTKIKSIRESNHTELIELLSDDNIKKYITDNISPNMLDVTYKGTYVFDLSKMSQEMEGIYATFSLDKKALKDEDKINELRNMLTLKQLELDYKTMEINYGEIFLRKSEILTELEGNNLNNMLIKKTKTVIESTEEQIKDLNNLPSSEQVQLTTYKQKILDMYKTGKDIVKKI